MRETFDWVLKNLKRIDSWIAILVTIAIGAIIIWGTSFVAGFVAGLLTPVAVLLWDRES